MGRLVLVRHSVPEVRRNVPASDWTLGEVGRHRTILLASRLRSFRPELIWSSKEPKTIQTAEILSDSLGSRVRILNGLEEHHRENVPLMSKEQFSTKIDEFFSNPNQVVLGSETAVQARDRMVTAIDEILKVGHSDSIVVTHGTVMTLYMAAVAGVRSFCFWRQLGLPSYVVLSTPSMRVLSIVRSLLSRELPDCRQ